MKSQYSLPIAILAVGALIAGGIFLVSQGKPSQPQGTVADARPVDQTDHIIGNPDAPLKIVEYADLECPYCKVFHETMQQVMDYYGPSGKVAWVFRNFPLGQIHSKAPTEAAAAECAFDQGGNDAFFRYIKRLFEITPSQNGLDLAKLPQIASEVGLDANKLSQCLSANTNQAKVQAQYNEAIAAGLQGTPAVVFMTSEGAVLSLNGAQPYASMRAAIDEILAQLGESVSTSTTSTTTQ